MRDARQAAGPLAADGQIRGIGGAVGRQHGHRDRPVEPFVLARIDHPVRITAEFGLETIAAIEARTEHVSPLPPRLPDQRPAAMVQFLDVHPVCQVAAQPGLLQPPVWR